jgi:hypothetical protein
MEITYNSKMKILFMIKLYLFIRFTNDSWSSSSLTLGLVVFKLLGFPSLLGLLALHRFLFFPHVDDEDII